MTQKYAAEVAMKHRQTFGQFFTPDAVAEFMCRWVMDSDVEEVFDPAFGLGAFYRAARKLNPAIGFSSYEIDEKILDYYRVHEIESDPSLRLSCEDYFCAWGVSAKAIVCNPPYQRFQHFKNRSKVFQRYEDYLGLKLTGYTNTASAFLLKSLHELQPGGRLAYIMPFEFLNTGYGGVVKEELLKDGLLKELIRIDAEKDVFPEAITTIVIVLAARDGIADPVMFSTVESLAELEMPENIRVGKSVSRNALNPNSKWLGYFENNQHEFQKDLLVPLAYYGNFSRGIATGANEFFALSKSDISRHRLPEKAVSSCITKSAQVKKPIFTENDLLSLSDSDAPVYVLDVHGKPDAAVMAYIKLGEEKEFDKRYLTKCRNPWYKLEHRSPAPIWMGVFSRNGYKVIRNYSSAVNLTCYHGFHPNIFGAKYVDHLFAYFLSRAGQAILKSSMRRYGDKLDKFEPNDLNDALVPSPEFFDRLDPCLLANLAEMLKDNERFSELDVFFNQLISDSTELILNR
jgi:adenine-specific DNA-methyltransferase